MVIKKCAKHERLNPFSGFAESLTKHSVLKMTKKSWRLKVTSLAPFSSILKKKHGTETRKSVSFKDLDKPKVLIYYLGWLEREEKRWQSVDVRRRVSQNVVDYHQEKKGKP